MQSPAPSIKRHDPRDLQPSHDYRVLCKTSEGLFLRAYDDGGGTWTIGWGHTNGVRAGLQIDQQRADEMFDADTMQAVGVLRYYVQVPLQQGEFDALTDFIFNEGPTHFEHSTLLRMLNQANYSEAARDLLMWDKMHHKILRGLHRRRMAEKYLFENGKLPPWIV